MLNENTLSTNLCLPYPPSRYVRKTNRADARVPKFVSSKAMKRAKEVVNLSKKERKKTKDKGMHWFLTGVLKRLDNDDFSVRNSTAFNRLFATLPREYKLHGKRIKVFDESMKMFFELADHATGYIERGCISSLSNRLDLTTYGKALYYKGKRVDGTILEEKGKLKPNTSRFWKFIDFLCCLGFCEKTSIEDFVTKEKLPSIIRMTDDFYYALGVTPKQLIDFRLYKIRSNKKAYYDSKDIGIDNYTEKLDNIVYCKGEDMRADRMAYRKKVRLSQQLKRLTPVEVYQRGRRIVNSRYRSDELANMTNTHYELAVKHELDNLFNAASLKVPPLIH